MSLLSRLAAAFRPPRNAIPLPAITRGTSLFDDLAGLGSGLPSPSESTAWTVAAITACVNLIAGAISGLPLHVYRRDKAGNRDRLFDDPIWWVLNEQWSPRWSAASAWTHFLECHLLHGDGFAEILRAPGGEVAGIEPIHTSRCAAVAVNPQTRRLLYAFNDDPVLPPSGRGYTVLEQDDVLHISGSGFDGLRTPSPLRNSLRMSGAVAMATQEFSARFFANGARPDYALVTDEAMGPEAIENLRAQIDERHRGVENAHRPILLHSGLDVKPLQLPLEDLQLIATRQFQIEEIARAYGVPPFMIGHNEKTTSWGSGVEQMGNAFVRYTLNRHLKRIHAEFNRKLFRTYAKVVEFDTFELERADMKSLFEAFRTGIGRAGEGGFLSVNEVRASLNLKPKDDGDELKKDAADAKPQEPVAAQS